jgi:hypothetical protein
MIDCLSRDQSIMWDDCIDETKKRRKTVVNKKELFYYYNAFTYTSITIIEVFIGFKKKFIASRYGSFRFIFIPKIKKICTTKVIETVCFQREKEWIIYCVTRLGSAI